ncbi:MAG TPA: phosphoglucomutase/phosphomannomutase family protein [Candidatus Acidoferrales bacterium]|nr:phosphoglucomutase/phosphomannomutase family protein [Candidatus Acidoferrales bacterium]
MSHKPIRFGTSGWRGLIADDFTFARVRAAVAAIADYVRKKNPRRPRLVVGYDTRFLSDEFARDTVKVLAENGVGSFLCTEPTPTPTIAFEILRRKADGGINFTASHNPAEYNGLKFSTPDGAPALPEVTKQIERLAAKHLRAKATRAKKAKKEAGCEEIDPRPTYLDALVEKIDVEVIQRARLKVAYDPLYGTGAGVLDRFLADRGIEVHTVHGYRDALFGGHPPEPADEILEGLRELIREHDAHVGLSTDGDADRFGMLDRDGKFISPNHIISLLLDYLLETRREWPRGVARSVATTHLVDAVARHHDVPVHETPVGFKYIGELIKQDKITIGGEESAGLSVYGHVPEKDGVLACLLVAEMVARRGASLGEQLQALFAKVGAYYPVRVNLHLDEAKRDRVAQRIKKDPKSFDGRRVAGVNRTDGLKLLFDDDAWVLMRLSGTEPVVRCYCEAHSEAETAALVAAAQRFVAE